jgi:hypothetical protein
MNETPSLLVYQVKEGDMTCVAGGLRLTHPSVLPFIKEKVSMTNASHFNVEQKTLQQSDNLVIAGFFLPRSVRRIAFEDFQGSSRRGLFENHWKQCETVLSRLYF